MNVEEYHKMRALESTYWWFRARRHIILTILREVMGKEIGAGSSPRCILDIGCGTGMLMEDLAHFGRVCGLDFSPVALNYCKQRGLSRLARADVQAMPIRSQSVDLVTALDLVEHVPDDRRLMAELYRILAPGALALLTVPAHPSLWSDHDVALHHHRRYTKRAFRELLNEAGFQVLRYSYMMMTIYPAAAAFRYAKRVLPSARRPHTDEFPLPSWLNESLRLLVSAEASLLRRWNLPCGLSLVAVVRKPVAATNEGVQS